MPLSIRVIPTTWLPLLGASVWSYIRDQREKQPQRSIAAQDKDVLEEAP
jgi:hypothetical protein